MDDWYKFIQTIIFPNQCILCRGKCEQRRDLCQACEQDLSWLPQQICYRCAMPLQLVKHELDQNLCGRCLIQQPPFKQTIALCHYRSPIDQIISQLKFNNDLVMAEVIGGLMADYLTRKQVLGYHLPKLIIPMPLHSKRLKERGFNQALELARPIARQFGIPIAKSACIRTKATQPQSELSRKARMQNVRAAFSVTDAGMKLIAGNHIAVIDDVMTTGMTMIECCRALSQAKPRRIDVWCFARTTI